MNKSEVEEAVTKLRDLYLRHCAKLISEIWDKYGDLPETTFDDLGLGTGNEMDFVIGYARAIQEKAEFPELKQDAETP